MFSPGGAGAPLRPRSQTRDSRRARNRDRRAIPPSPQSAVGRAGRSTVVLAASSTGALSRRLAALEPATRQHRSKEHLDRRPAPNGRNERGTLLTAQGSSRAIFHRAIERGNLAVAETTLRAEIPRPTLVDLLELTALIALKEPQRHPRVSARWLQRWLEAHQFPTILRRCVRGFRARSPRRPASRSCAIRTSSHGRRSD